ncbi:hypothetical protein HYDPIDRAFT_110897 [Hydnomerulius pinastri MD-312]|uniref:Uncharacterized protein n=1 Tax=Hydnomerulius pinastri MD-312 TaxID=994086 RepID=A0A0C9WAJ0_9AGAM|nr:hypothetical protein HYDPIDRAFT_110897 [Hydnomerulius pinastri MD-312]
MECMAVAEVAITVLMGGSLLHAGRLCLTIIYSQLCFSITVPAKIPRSRHCQ